MKLSEFQNPNGSYNGAAFLARLTDRTEAEVLWIWKRAQFLHTKCNMATKEAVSVAFEEAQKHSWNEPPKTI